MSIPSSYVCIYCNHPRSEHTQTPAIAGMTPEWSMCPKPHDRAVHDTTHYRKPGPTVHCERCGNDIPLPENITRLLGGGQQLFHWEELYGSPTNALPQETRQPNEQAPHGG